MEGRAWREERVREDAKRRGDVSVCGGDVQERGAHSHVLWDLDVVETKRVEDGCLVIDVGDVDDNVGCGRARARVHAAIRHHDLQGVLARVLVVQGAADCDLATAVDGEGGSGVGGWGDGEGEGVVRGCCIKV